MRTHRTRLPHSRLMCSASTPSWPTASGGSSSVPEANSSGCARPGGTPPAVFSSLIGGGGVYAVTPADRRFVWGGYYEPGTLIWRSRWITSTGIIECREALAFPADAHNAVILRRVIAVQGTASVRVLLEARAELRAGNDERRDPPRRSVDGSQRRPLPAVVGGPSGRRPSALEG